MATEFGGILGQVDVAATTSTDLYKAPPHSRVRACVEVCNRNASAVDIRISISVAGAALTTKDYVVYDKSVAANDTFEWGAVGSNMKLIGPSDVIRVYSGTANVSFTAYGQVE